MYYEESSIVRCNFWYIEIYLMDVMLTLIKMVHCFNEGSETRTSCKVLVIFFRLERNVRATSQPIPEKLRVFWKQSRKSGSGEAHAPFLRNFEIFEKPCWQHSLKPSWGSWVLNSFIPFVSVRSFFIQLINCN